MGARGANAALIGRQARAELSTTIRDVMVLAVDNLKNATPVDTEHAASNWIASVRSPFTGVAGSREAVSYAEQDAGIAKLERYDVGRDGPVYIRNNVDYVTYLDEGWSQQAPPGFVAIALDAAARRAPYGKTGAVRKMLKGLSRAAITRRSSGARNAAVARNVERHGGG